MHRVAAFAAPVDGRPETLTHSLAVRLVIDRVRERGGRLVVDEDHAAALAALCRRCAGLPLALELVAAQLASLPPGDVLDQLDDVALAGDDELRQVAEAGCALLADDEAAVFRRLAVLDGPASLTTIRGVVVDDLVPPLRVVRILGELADRGLVTVRRGGPRLLYAQDDDLRRVAAERLVASGEARGHLPPAGGDRARPAAGRPRTAPGPFAEQVTAVLDSVRSLLAAGVDGELDVGTALEIAFRLHRYWATTSISEGRFWLSRLLAADGRVRDARRLDGVRALRPGLPELLGRRQRRRDPRARGLAARSSPSATSSYATRAMIFLGGALDDLDRTREAELMARRALELAEAAPDAATTPGVSLRVGITINLAAILAQRGDAPPYSSWTRPSPCARPKGRPTSWPCACRRRPGTAGTSAPSPRPAATSTAAGRSWARAAGSPTPTCSTAATAVALGDGDLDAAVEHGTAAEAEAAGLGIDRNLPFVRALLARALLGRGEVDQAARVAADAVRSGRELSVQYPVADALEAAAAVAERVGAPAQDVALLLGAAADVRARGERPPPVPLRSGIEALRARVGDSRGSAARPGGRLRPGRAAPASPTGSADRRTS